MKKENLKEKYLIQISRLREEENLLLSEARKLLRSETEILNSNLFNEIYREYKELKMKEEFLNYCLMLDYVLDNH